ncbi:MAG TPA: cation:proton antiporter [Jatrophihabitans sp.]|nr:cation:proton antiporter [Jatrophihabitans sp.]
MPVSAFVAFAAAVVVYVSGSRRLDQRHISAPMIFTVVGALVGVAFTGQLEVSAVRNLAELTLALVLFHDAAQIQPRQLRGDVGLCLRLLLLGLPLTIAAGFGVAWLLFPGIGGWLALLLAAAVAPTDAGLGAATVLNPLVPVRVRRVLNVESGLNDGLCTPVVLLALAAAGGEGEHHVGTAVVELLLGAVIGVLLGVACGRMLGWANASGLIEKGLLPIGAVAVPLLCYYGAVAVGGNGFVAAFVSGTAFAAAIARRSGANTLQLTEWGAAVFGYAVWCLFGIIVVSRIGELVTWPALGFALLSLTLLRMAPVALVLLGTGFARPSRLFVGWFGPRGLASVVFGLIATEELPANNDVKSILGAIALTVLLSVVLHGVSADIGAQRYGAWAVQTQPQTELKSAVEPVIGRTTARR